MMTTLTEVDVLEIICNAGALTGQHAQGIAVEHPQRALSCCIVAMVVFVSNEVVSVLV